MGLWEVCRAACIVGPAAQIVEEVENIWATVSGCMDLYGLLGREEFAEWREFKEDS